MKQDDPFKEAEDMIYKAAEEGATQLDLAEMGLTDVPESISRLTNLKNLSLEANTLSAIPESIGYLTNLEILVLDANRLTTLPESIGQLANLRFLSLYRNQLTSIPESIGHLSNLEHLDLGHNKLTKLPLSINQLLNLENFNINDNPLDPGAPFSDAGEFNDVIKKVILRTSDYEKLEEDLIDVTKQHKIPSGEGFTETPLDDFSDILGEKKANLSGEVDAVLEPSTATYMLTWNPERYKFSEFEKRAHEIQDQGSATLGWSVGKRKNVTIGDRVFLMRQGRDNPGIVGSGFVDSEVNVLPHWDPEERKEEKTYNQVLIKWDTLRENPILSRDDLITATEEKKLWDSQVGGVVIKPEVAQKLEAAWEKALKQHTEPPPKKEPSAPKEPPPSEPPPVRDEPTVPRAWVETDAIPVIGNIRDYKPSQFDSLNAKDQAEIFATLLVAKDVQPPFALGLLGDWGVGKTFFMRLMQEIIASMAGKEAEAEDNADSVSRAAQIEFNAWHYVDSDLWASLASHIFDGLSNELSSSEENADEARRRLRREIHSSQREEEEAQAAIKTAQDARKKFAIDLAKNQEERTQIASQYESHLMNRIWKAVLEVKPDENIEEQKKWPDMAKNIAKAEKVAKQLGITEAIDSVEEVQQVYTIFKETMQRGSGLSRAIANLFSLKNLWLSGPIVILLIGVLLGMPWIIEKLDLPTLVEKIEAYFGVAKNTFNSALSPFLQILAIVSTAATWASRNLKSISSATGYLEQILQEIKEPRVKPATPSPKEVALKGAVEEIDARIASEKRRIEEADRQIAEAQAEIQRIDSGGLVYDFLEGRIHDSRYLDRLGLISVIRKDFELLGSLLETWRERGKKSADKKSQQAEYTWDTRPIERIILYIDDLDRCPPKRVVEVLQAVHLILAFDLFVVVVAVDARWLERSLNESYNPVRDTRDNHEFQETGHRFSAHNYLEKIFQIPFSLPVMEKSGYHQLVADMIATPKKQAERNAQRQEAERRRQGQQRAQEQKDDSHAGPSSRTSPEDGRPAVPDQDDNEEKRRQRKEIEEQEKKAEKQRRERDRQKTLQRIKAMLLHDYEEKFIMALFPFISTPRLAKRFLNIYRLIRVSAASNKIEFKKFIHPEQGEYRAVLILLAIVVGRADAAAEILNDLSGGESKKFTTWLRNSYKEQNKTDPPPNSGQDGQSQESNAPVSINDTSIRTVDLRKAALGINQDLKGVIKYLNDHEGPKFDDHLAAYRKWTREVGRYSFQWHLKLES